jgi:tetratricopeptide (TPR) repeat protein
LKYHRETNLFLVQGNDYSLLGRIYFGLEKLEDATAACQKALEFHKLANSALGQGNDHQVLGRIHLSQNKPNEAH